MSTATQSEPQNDEMVQSVREEGFLEEYQEDIDRIEEMFSKHTSTGEVNPYANSLPEEYDGMLEDAESFIDAAGFALGADADPEEAFMEVYAQVFDPEFAVGKVTLDDIEGYGDGVEIEYFLDKKEGDVKRKVRVNPKAGDPNVEAYKKVAEIEGSLEQAGFQLERNYLSEDWEAGDSLLMDADSEQA